MKTAFDRKAKLYSEEYSQEEQRSMDAISTQLNSYVKEFAEEYGYDYIMGATGGGNLWYIKPAKNITEDVLIYVNLKYEGM